MFGFGRQWQERSSELGETKSTGLLHLPSRLKRQFKVHSFQATKTAVTKKQSPIISGFVNVSLLASPLSDKTEEDDTWRSRGSSTCSSTTTTLQEAFALRRTSSSLTLLEEPLKQDGNAIQHQREPSMQSIELMMGDLTVWEEEPVIDRWAEAKLAVLHNENDHRVDGAALRLAYPMQHIDWSMRRMLVVWMNEVSNRLRLIEAFYLGVNYLDRYITQMNKEKRHMTLCAFQCVGAACLWIATKTSERYPPTAEDFCICGDHAFTRDDLIAAEMDILRIIQWKIHHVTPVIMLDCLTSVPHCPFRVTETVRQQFNRWLEMALFEAEMYVYPVSILTFSALLLSLPHEERATAENFIVEDMRWMLARGWQASLYLPTASTLATWRQHCATPFCPYKLCQLKAEKEQHHADCPYPVKKQQKAPLARPDSLLPLQSMSRDAPEDQALMALAQCITSLLVMDAHRHEPSQLPPPPCDF